MPALQRVAASFLFALLVLTAPATWCAASETANIYYGRGVQAYLDGQWAKAEAYFDRSITYDPQNPRAYYFRGLTRQKLDQPYRADGDLQQGAALEANLGGSFRLGSAITAVAQADRERLTQVRTEMLGQLPSLSHTPSLPRGAERQAQSLRAKFRLSLDVLESVESPAELAQLVEATRPTAVMLASRSAPAAPPAAAAADPFVDDPLIPEEARGTMSLGALTGAFGDALGSFIPSPPAQLQGLIPSGSGLPGTGPEALGPGGPGDAMPGGGDDPFGGSAGEDPFGGAPAVESDPFADGPEGAESQPAEEAMEEPAGDNPFGAPEDAGDNPFGAPEEAGDPFGGGPFGGDDAPADSTEMAEDPFK